MKAFLAGLQVRLYNIIGITNKLTINETIKLNDEIPNYFHHETVVISGLDHASPRTTLRKYRHHHDPGTKMLKEFRSSVNVTGIERIFDRSTHVSRRIVWAFLIFGGTVFLAYHLYKRIEYYTTNPVMININVVYPTEMPFPAITVCNTNQFRDEPGHPRTNLDERVIRSLMMAGNGSELTKAEVKNYNITHLVLNHTHSMKDMLIDCGWGMNTCTYSNFTQIFIDFEVCYTFNLDNALVVTAAGIQYGLYLEMQAQLELYSPYTPDVGFKLIVHNPEDIPTVFTTTSFVSLNPGTSTYISLKKIVTNSLPPPFGKCGLRKLRHYSEYSATKCYFECMANYSLYGGKDNEKGCGCLLAHMPGDPKDTCNPINYGECTIKLLEQYAKQTSECKCPLDCQDVHYEKSITVSKFSPRFVYNTHNANDDVVRIFIFFEELRYTSIDQQEAYTWLALLSDIGGALGLVLGSCLLTIAQLADVIITAVLQRAAMRRYRERKNCNNNYGPRTYPRTFY